MSRHENGSQLIHDVQTVIKDAETLLKNSALPLSEDFKSAKERFEVTLKKAKDEVVNFERRVVDKTKEAALITDNYVRENPWQAAGLGAAIGLVLGLLISRR